MNSASRRLWLLLVLLIAVIGLGFGIEAVLTGRINQPFGHTQGGHLVGWAGLALIALVFVYPARKRHYRTRSWPRGWFRVHMAAGVLGPSLIFVHAGAHLHALVPVLALVTLVIVVVSGVIGQGVHYVAVRRLYERQHELADRHLDPVEIEGQVHRLAAEERVFRLWQTIHAPATLLFVVLTILHVVAALYFGGL